MELSTYADTIRRDLLTAAEAGGPEVRETIERLTYAIDPAARLALMEAISQAAAEISAELVDASVDVRLDGRDLDFVVQQSIPSDTPAGPAVAPGGPDEAAGEGPQSRVTLRLPESLKARAEEEAARVGQSLNTWLVGAVRAASTNPTPVTDLTSQPFTTPTTGSQSTQGPRRLSGWL